MTWALALLGRFAIAIATCFGRIIAVPGGGCGIDEGIVAGDRIDFDPIAPPSGRCGCDDLLSDDCCGR